MPTAGIAQCRWPLGRLQSPRAALVDDLAQEKAGAARTRDTLATRRARTNGAQENGGAHRLHRTHSAGKLHGPAPASLASAGPPALSSGRHSPNQGRGPWGYTLPASSSAAYLHCKKKLEPTVVPVTDVSYPSPPLYLHLDPVSLNRHGPPRCTAALRPRRRDSPTCRS